MNSSSRGGISLGSSLVVLLSLLSASVAVAQINTGEIDGVVRDSSGGVLPGATRRRPRMTPPASSWSG